MLTDPLPRPCTCGVADDCPAGQVKLCWAKAETLRVSAKDWDSIQDALNADD